MKPKSVKHKGLSIAKCALATLALSSVAFIGPLCEAQDVRVMERIDPQPTPKVPLKTTAALAQAPGTWLEKFDKVPAQGWVFIGDASVKTEGQQRMLVTNGWAAGGWQAPGEITDFSLRLRYRHANGIGDVVLRGKPTDPIEYMYHVLLANDRVFWVREMHQKPRELKSAAYALKPGQWYDISIQLNKGNLVVAIGGKTVLTAEDPDPLGAGLIGLGSLAGNGYAYDDISLTLSPSVGPPTGPSLAQVETVRTPVMSLTARPLTERLAQIGVVNSDELVQKIQTRQALVTLSHQAKMAPEELLFTAQEAELTQTLGSQNVTPQEMSVLRAMNLQRPEDFSQFRGQVDRLALIASRWAQRLGVAPPSEQRLQQWLDAVYNRTSALPAARALLPRTEVCQVPPAPYRRISLGENIDESLLPHFKLAKDKTPISTYAPIQKQVGVPGQPGKAAELQSPKAGTGAAIEAIKKPDAIVGLALPKKSLYYEFSAPRYGLYQAEIAFRRPGGTATLKWYVEKPKVAVRFPGTSHTTLAQAAQLAIANPTHVVTTEVTGWGPMINGDADLTITDADGGETYYAYFWVSKNDVPLNRRLRVRLEIVANSDLVQQPAASSLETDRVIAVPADRPILGGVNVSRCMVNAELDKALKLKFLDKTNPKDSGPMVVAVEAAFQPNWEEHKDGSPAHLDIVLKGRAGDQERHWYNVDILRDALPVKTERHQGLSEVAWENTFRCMSPVKAGIYTVLISPPDWVDLKTLSTSGKVFSQRSHDYGSQDYNGLEHVEVTFDTQGDKLPLSYVVELDSLQVRGQAEDEEDSNDEDDGEFYVASTVSYLQTPDVGKTAAEIKNISREPTKAEVVKHGWPTWGGMTRIPQETGGERRHIIYPCWALAQWTDEDLQEFNRVGVSLSVVEEDARDYWDWMSECLVKSLGRLFKIVASVWKGDLPAATKAFMEHVYETYTAKQLNMISDVWDMIGFPAYTFDADLAQPFLQDANRDCAYIDPRGPCDPKLATDIPETTGYKTGSSTDDVTWAQAGFILRKVPTYWAVSDACLLSFTLSEDLDSGEDAPTDVWIVREPLCKVGLYDNRFLLRESWKQLDKFTWAYEPTEVGARAHQRVAVDPDTPPYEVAKNVWSWDASPCFYVEWHMYDKDPGGYEDICTFARTFYYVDFVKNAAPSEAEATWDPRDAGRTLVRYYKKGPYYIGHFVLNQPGGYLEQLELKVYVRLFGG